jgi:hypothetical protein
VFSEGTSAQWLFSQEKVILYSDGNATHELENRSKRFADTAVL